MVMGTTVVATTAVAICIGVGDIVGGVWELGMEGESGVGVLDNFGL